MQTKTKVLVAIVVILAVVAGVLYFYPGLGFSASKGTPSKYRCIILQRWYDRDMLTAKVKGDFTDWEACKPYREAAEEVVETDDGKEVEVPSKSRCRLLKYWINRGVLTKKLKGDTRQWKACVKYHPEAVK